MDFLADYYKDNVSLRMLLQLIPQGIGSAVDVYLTNLIDSYKKEKIRLFFQDIESCKIHISQEVIESNDFLYAFFATTKSVINTKRNEKITYFSNLFINGLNKDLYKTDKYEQYLIILDELTYQEIQILEILKKFEVEIHKKPEIGDKSEINPLQKANSIWDSFEKEVFFQISIEPEILRNMLTRLTGTGLYETIAGMYFNYEGGRGFTTSLYDDFRLWIMESK